MRTNKTKAKVATGECVIGVNVAFPSPDLVELCAAVGFDFVAFDTGDAVDRMGDYMRIGSKLFTISPMNFPRQGGIKLTPGDARHGEEGCRRTREVAPRGNA
jgi:hypothetical protein